MTRFHEVGKFTSFYLKHSRVLTNLKELTEPLVEHASEISVLALLVCPAKDDQPMHYQLESEVPPSTTSTNILARLGITDSYTRKWYQNGKFVYMKDDSFYLFNQALEHAAIVHAQEKDYVATLSAGFSNLDIEGQSLYGRSFSLNNREPDFEGRDLAAFQRQLGLPFDGGRYEFT